MQSPFALFQWLRLVKARPRFPVGFEHLIPFDVDAEVIVLQEFASGVSVVVREGHADLMPVARFDGLLSKRKKIKQ